jgi:hypothetical protein
MFCVTPTAPKASLFFFVEAQQMKWGENGKKAQKT